MPSIYNVSKYVKSSVHRVSAWMSPISFFCSSVSVQKDQQALPRGDDQGRVLGTPGAAQKIAATFAGNCVAL